MADAFAPPPLDPRPARPSATGPDAPRTHAQTIGGHRHPPPVDACMEASSIRLPLPSVLLCHSFLRGRSVAAHVLPRYGNASSHRPF